MPNIVFQVLSLIREEYSLNEMSQILNLPHKDLYGYINILESRGFDFERKYYYSGDIVYLPRTSVSPLRTPYTNIYTSSTDKTFKALLIADLHIGNCLERLDILQILFDYCAKEGINVIICCGDFHDGVLTGNGKKKYPDSMLNAKNKYPDSIDTIDYCLNAYPHDDHIITYTILGNHDISFWDYTGQNFAETLINHRHDIVPLGYGKGELHVKNDIIVVKHKLTAAYKPPNPEIIPPLLVLKGHSHGTKVNMNHTGLCIVNVPTCCDIVKEDFIPGAIKMTLEFDHGLFSEGMFEQLMVDNGRVVRVNEILCDLSFGKDTPTEILLEEDRIKKLVKEK